MRPALRELAAALAAGMALGALVGACSLSARFEEEGRPCGAGGTCAQGYSCVENECRAVDGACPECPEGTVCDPSSRTCIASSCATRICAVGFSCVEEESGTRCRPILRGLGQSCTRDAQCTVEGPGRVCYSGTVQQSSGALRPGFCVETCTSPGAACQTPQATCQNFKLGLGASDVNLCVTPQLVSSCTRNADCGSGDLICTVFDHPQVGPASFCDSPLKDGAGIGEACSTAAGGGALCANGLCVPREPAAGQAARCGELCAEGTCQSGSCQPVEFRTPAQARFIPVCVTESTACRPCPSGAAACGADAPRCTTYGGQPRCLAECALDAGPGSTCPTGYTCNA
ncbi:MAG TPA: hypothetical protein VEY30_01310, partial [Myxococcaceae bacterium]|nr:hypothetical protein [Myxococcaceae bacterium]